MRPLVFAAIISTLAASPALAHTLDHYAQATTVLVERDAITLELHLTVGHAVADTVLAEIDADGDGALSAAEQAAYGERVLADLALALDGVPQPLALASAGFPAIDAMLEGTGAIVLVIEAPAPPPGGSYSLSFENGHRGDIAVYLVNALVPQDPGIAILSQERSADQSIYTLEFSVAP